MSTKIKSKALASALGKEIKRRRLSYKIKLLDISKDINIDVGQLSRFENGKFKYISKNMQIYLGYLHITNHDSLEASDLIYRFTIALNKSSRHLEAGSHMVSLLESL